MQALAQRRVLLGVTGSIAAYKTPILVRRLVEAGAEVQVVMTAAAKQFVTPMTLAAVSGHPVRDDLWDESAELAMGHIELARWADLVVIAPASADTLARLASGRADDLLSTLCLATTAEIVVAPAMNHVMWAHPATRANMARLAERGVACIGPETGELAERESGAGRMTEPEAIRDALIARYGVRYRRAGRAAGGGYGRADPRGTRPGALSHQSFLRPHGLCAGRRLCRSGGHGHARLRAVCAGTAGWRGICHRRIRRRDV